MEAKVYNGEKKKKHVDVMKINGYTKAEAKEEQNKRYNENVLKKMLERSEGWTKRRRKIKISGHLVRSEDRNSVIYVKNMQRRNLSIKEGLHYIVQNSKLGPLQYVTKCKCKR
jgi:hypothetical protein